MRYLVPFLLGAIALFAQVDINKAGVAELSSLYNVGEKKAAAIVAYREEHGCFGSVEELAKVRGISTKTLEKNRGEMTAGSCGEK